MALRYSYTDAFLAKRVTQVHEDQAAGEVAMHGTFPASWVEQLTVRKTYMIVCIECLATDDDTFSTKLKSYRQMFNDGLVQARIAQAAAEAAAGTASTGGGGIFTIDLQRA